MRLRGALRTARCNVLIGELHDPALSLTTWDESLPVQMLAPPEILNAVNNLTHLVDLTIQRAHNLALLDGP